MSTPVWDGWAKIQTLLASAAAAMATPITLVKRGVPLSVPTDMIRWWFDGCVDSPFSGNATTRTQDGIALRVGVFLRIPGGATFDQEAAIDDRLENADNSIQAALWGDVHLGDFSLGTNSATGVAIGDTATSVELVDGAAVRYLEIPIVYGVADRHTIA